MADEAVLEEKETEETQEEKQDTENGETQETEEEVEEKAAKSPRFQKRIDELNAKIYELENRLEEKAEEKPVNRERTWQDLSTAELEAISADPNGQYEDSLKRRADRELAKREAREEVEQTFNQREWQKSFDESRAKALSEYPDLDNPGALANLTNQHMKRGIPPLEAARAAAQELGIVPKGKSGKIKSLEKAIDKERSKKSLDTTGPTGLAGASRQATLQKLMKEANETQSWKKVNDFIKANPQGSFREGTYIKPKSM